MACQGEAVIYCKVCGAFVPPRRKYKPKTCEACQKFFRRYCKMNDSSFVCLEGKGNCSVNQSSRRWCPKCRFQKCLAIGMRSKHLGNKQRREKKQIRDSNKVEEDSSSQPNTLTMMADTNDMLIEMADGDDEEEQIRVESPTTPMVQSPEISENCGSSNNDIISCPDKSLDQSVSLIKNPVAYDGTVVESILRSSITNFTKLHAYHFLPLSNSSAYVDNSQSSHLEPINNRQIFDMLGEQHLRVGLGIGLSYTRAFAELEGLTAEDFLSLQKIGSFTQLAPLFFALPNISNTNFFGFHDNLLPTLVQLYPSFMSVAKKTEMLTRAMGEWNPSFAITALLLGLILFNEKCTQSPNLARIRRRLLLGLELCISKQVGGRPDALVEAKRQYELCLRLVQAVDSSCFQVLGDIARSSPQLADALAGLNNK